MRRSLLLATLDFVLSLNILGPVDVNEVFCRPDGAGEAMLSFWPPSLASTRYVKQVANGCGELTAVSGKHKAQDRMDCEAQCDADASCSAYEFCEKQICGDKCRLQLSPLKDGHGMEKGSERGDCYVKQPRNESKPHVVTFFRKSSEAAASSMTFTITDSSPEPRAVVDDTQLTFASLSSRRLSTSDDVAGRTSAPARRGKGGGHGGGHGSHGGSSHGSRSRGHTTSSHVSRPHMAGRPRQDGHIAGQPKVSHQDGRTMSGQRTPGRFWNPRHTWVGGYGYTYTYMPLFYPFGYWPTAYGYAGLGYSRHRLVACSGCHGNVTGEQKVTSSNSPYLFTELNLTEDLRRDDLMTTGFIPSNFSYPLRLKVTSLGYNNSKLCNRFLREAAPQALEQLFLSITEVEEVEEVEDSPVESAGQIFFYLFLVAATCLLMGRWWYNKSERLEGKANTFSYKFPQYEGVPSRFGALD